MPLMRPTLRPSLVATVSLGLVACGGTRTSNPPPPEMTHNPPMPQPLGGSGGAAGGGATASATGTSVPLAVNPPPTGTGSADARPGAQGSGFKTHPRDARHHLILKNREGGCFVEIPVPTDKPLPPGGRSIRTENVPCPPIMNDPAYGKCVGGTIQLKGTGCECFVGGNPPPPAVALTCPAQ